MTSDDCALPNGKLDVRLVDGSGAELPVDSLPLGPPPSPQTLLIRPGQLIFGSALWAAYEGRAARPVRLAIYPNRVLREEGDAISVPVADVVVPARPRRPSNRGQWRATSYGYLGRVADPGALTTLTASLLSPATIGVGPILRYSVSLANATPAAVPLSPCPDFAQLRTVKAPGRYTRVGSCGRLNCDPAPAAIASGESVTFDFELEITGQLTGHGALTWSLLDDTTASVTARTGLTVTG